MAHFAEVDKNGIVLRVLVIPDEQQHRGKDFLSDDLGNQHPSGNPLHKNYAGIGFIFDGVGFCAPRPYPSWILNAVTYLWEAPVPKPEGYVYWDENSLSWIEK
jgi:hypothetical protein